MSSEEINLDFGNNIFYQFTERCIRVLVRTLFREYLRFKARREGFRPVRRIRSTDSLISYCSCDSTSQSEISANPIYFTPPPPPPPPTPRHPPRHPDEQRPDVRNRPATETAI